MGTNEVYPWAFAGGQCMMVMDVVFHRLHLALPRTIEAGVFFFFNIFTRLLFLAV